MSDYQPFIELNGYSDPPTWDNYVDFCDRANISPDSPVHMEMTAEQFSERYNYWSARKNCTPEVAKKMLEVEWPKGTKLNATLHLP